MSWRARSLLREAWFNTWANPARSAVVVLIAAAAVGLLAFLELRQAEDIRKFQEEYAAAGGYLAIVAGQEGPIDAARCEALRGLPGVVAAGSQRGTGTVSFVTAPGLLFQSAAVSAGVLAVWRPGMSAEPAPLTGAMVAGVALARELGLRGGSYTVRVGESPLLVSAVLDAGRRNRQVQRWALDIAPPAGPADECWVEFERNAYASGSAALAAWFASGAQEPVVRPYFRPDEFTRDPAKEFAARPEGFGWLAAAGLIVAVSLLAAWFRRAELGLYLALGTPRPQLWALIALETAFLVTAASALALPWAFAIHRTLDHPLPWDHVRVALRSGLSGASLGLVLAPVVATFVARGSVAGLLKER